MKYRLINEKMLKTINEINNTSLSKNQILNKTYFEIFNVDGNDLLEIDKNIINNQVVYEKEEIAKIKNKTKYFKTLKQPFYNEKGDVIGLIGYSTDITEIKEAQIKAEKEKEYELSFNQNYVHEVNNIFHKKTQIKYLLSIESILEEEKGDLLESLEHLENMHFQLMQNFSLHHNNLLQEKEIFLE